MRWEGAFGLGGARRCVGEMFRLGCVCGFCVCLKYIINSQLFLRLKSLYYFQYLDGDLKVKETVVV